MALHLPVIRELDRLPPLANRQRSGSRAAGDPSADLKDGLGRRYTYLRLSLTDRCNFACVYCMPPGGEADHAVRPELLTFEEIVRLVSLLAASGVRRLRLTGGEPLVRKDAVELVRRIRSRTPIDDIVMTSNAHRLPELARPLAEAGLRGVNISIDSLRPVVFRKVTRGGDLKKVLRGFSAALEAGLAVKLNIVALGGVNDDDVGPLVDFAWAHGVTPRFIELMPLGYGSSLRAHRRSASELIARLGERVEAQAWLPQARHHGPARYLPKKGDPTKKVGFITAISDEFCASCNRLRITARGELRTCLADRKGVSLRDVMRSGQRDGDILEAVRWALGEKDRGHAFLDPAAREHTHVGMSLVGG